MLSILDRWEFFSTNDYWLEFRIFSRSLKILCWKEQNIDITFDVFLNVRVSYFKGYLFPLELCFVHLTNRAWCYSFMVKLIKHLINIDTINPFENFFGLLLRMGRRVLPQTREFRSHFRSNNVSSMAKVLESFYPDNTCILNGP